MLKKINRLQKKRDFGRVFKNSHAVKTENLTFRVSKTKNPTIPSRFGFVVSNKIDKRATRRNGMKRRLRAIAAEMLPAIGPGLDVVILVNKQFDHPYKIDDFRKQIEEALSKI